MLLRSMGSMVEAAQRSVAIALHEPLLAYQKKSVGMYGVQGLALLMLGDVSSRVG